MPSVEEQAVLHLRELVELDEAGLGRMVKAVAASQWHVTFTYPSAARSFEAVFTSAGHGRQQWILAMRDMTMVHAVTEAFQEFTGRSLTDTLLSLGARHNGA